MICRFLHHILSHQSPLISPPLPFYPPHPPPHPLYSAVLAHVPVFISEATVMASVTLRPIWRPSGHTRPSISRSRPPASLWTTRVWGVKRWHSVRFLRFRTCSENEINRPDKCLVCDGELWRKLLFRLKGAGGEVGLAVGITAIKRLRGCVFLILSFSCGAYFMDLVALMCVDTVDVQ